MPLKSKWIVFADRGGEIVEHPDVVRVEVEDVASLQKAAFELVKQAMWPEWRPVLQFLNASHLKVYESQNAFNNERPALTADAAIDAMGNEAISPLFIVFNPYSDTSVFPTH